MTPCMNATRSWGSTGCFLCCLTAWQMSSRAPLQHKNILGDCEIISGNVLLECLPSSRATCTKGFCCLQQRVPERKWSGANSQQKRHPAALCESQGWCYCPWEDKPEPWNTLPSFPIFTSRWPLWNEETWSMCLSLSQMTKSCWWTMLIPSCLDPKSSWVHYSSLWLSKELQMSDFWKIWERLKGINYSFCSLW